MAYGRLVDRYEPRVARLMWRFTRDPGMREELVHDVFVEAYFSLRGYRGDAPFLHWLRRIGTRVGYRYWKQQKKQSRNLPLSDFDAPVETGMEIEATEAAEVLHWLLGRLRPADRLVLTLQYLEECSIREIADRTGWNEAMVKMRAYRARKKLKAIAQEENLLEILRWTR